MHFSFLWTTAKVGSHPLREASRLNEWEVPESESPDGAPMASVLVVSLGRQADLALRELTKARGGEFDPAPALYPAPTPPTSPFPALHPQTIPQRQRPRHDAEERYAGDDA